MEAEIDEARPPAWLARAKRWWWIGGHPSNAKLAQHAVSTFAEPRGMAWFADDASVERTAQQREEPFHGSRVKFKRRWQLDEQRAVMPTEPACFIEKLFQRAA